MTWRRAGSREVAGRRAFALPLVLGVAALLAAAAFTMFQYQSTRVWVTGATVNDLSALAAAEAGIACFLAELRLNPSFVTHEITGFGAKGEVQWGRELRRTQQVATKDELTVEKTASGSYKGAVGAFPYQAFFKLRAGYVPDRRAPDERSVKHLLIEALGFRQDPTKRQDRSTRVRLLVERSNFTEFLIYDGEWLTLGMGSGQDPNEYNIFADGRLYGHRWVHLGNITGGTRQKFLNLSTIRSAGKVKTWDDFRVVFQADNAPDAAAGGQAAFSVRFAPDVDSDGPSPLETAAGRILDGPRGGEIPPPTLDLADYRRRAAEAGIDLDRGKTAERFAWHSYPEFDDQEVITVDFGAARYDDPAGGDDARPEGLGVAYPGNFNGVVFSSRAVRVFGAPDRDLTLVSAKDIFVSGDFNARETIRQDYKRGFEPEGGGTPETRVPEARYYSYVTPERFRDDAGARLPPDQRDRQACALVAYHRVWRDYRLPGRPLRNELEALLAFELGLRLAALSPEMQGVAPDQAAAKLQEIARRYVMVDLPAGFSIDVPGFEGGAPAAQDGDGDGIPDLPGAAWFLSAMFPLDVPEREAQTQAAFKASPMEPQGDPSRQALLAGAVPKPHYWSDDKAPYYWTSWAASKPVKTKVHTVLLDALGRAQGKVTPEVVWGQAGQPGLVTRVYEALLEDEKNYPDHPGMGFFGGIPPGSTSRLALANAAQRLYELVRDEPDGDGKAGILSDEGGGRTEMQDDRLYLPQMTVNAMLFSNARKNDTNVPDGVLAPGNEALEADPTRTDRRFEELGNPLNQGLHYLTSLARMQGNMNNLVSPFVQRVRGAEIRLARGPVVAPRTRSGLYWPPIRRRLYDPDLAIFPPPGLPAQVLVKSWQNLGATKAEFQRY